MSLPEPSPAPADQGSESPYRRWGQLGQILLLFLLLAILTVTAVPPGFEIWWSLIILTLCAIISGRLYRQWALQKRRYFALQVQAETDKALSAERLALATELHDIVSDGLGLQHLRLTRALTETTDPTTLAIFTELRDANKQTIAKMRGVLARLQGHEATPPEIPDLEQIFSAAQGHGLTLNGAGEALEAIQRLPLPLRELFTITCREAIANTARHVGPTAVKLQIRESENGLCLELTDNGPTTDWQPLAGSGLGLKALHKKASAVGYILSAGPVGSGWSLRLTPLSVPTSPQESRSGT